MADFKTIWRGDRFFGDLASSEDGLAVGCDLTTAVLISLFTHRRAHRDDRLPDPENQDRRGWWADIANPRPIGSRLWLLSREKQTDDTMARAEAYAGEALEWLLEDGIAQRVDVRASNPRPGFLVLTINLFRVGHQNDQLLIEAPWAGIEGCRDIKIS